jgi:hypothetical protein
MSSDYAFLHFPHPVSWALDAHLNQTPIFRLIFCIFMQQFMIWRRNVDGEVHAATLVST